MAQSDEVIGDIVRGTVLGTVATMRRLDKKWRTLGQSERLNQLKEFEMDLDRLDERARETAQKLRTISRLLAGLGSSK